MRQTAVTSRPRATCKAPAAMLAGLLALAVGAAPITVAAQGRISIVRDAETEALLQDYSRAIFKVAGVPSSSVQIFLIPDEAFNAFVASGSQMFVNVGTIVGSETPGELIGVLAHEIGHLANNDLAQIRQAIDDAKVAVLIASIIGMGAAVAGSLTGAEGAAAAGSGIISGAASVGARGILRYQRGQEAAADRAAIGYLNATGQSSNGMVTTLKRLADQNLFLSRRADPYLQSHPLPRDRVVAVETLARQSKFFDRPESPALQRRHDMVRAKLVGFTWNSGRVLTRYPASDASLPARYARAIATYRFRGLASALNQIDGLIAANRSYPYFWELKGQALLETGNPLKAIDPLRRAASLAPNSGLIKILLGQALVAINRKDLAGEAVRVLSIALQTEADSASGFRALARAHELNGDRALAQLATAQGLFAEGNIKDAKGQAARAQAKLKTGSPAWLRADDIVSYNPPKER